MIGAGVDRRPGLVDLAKVRAAWLVASVLLFASGCFGPSAVRQTRDRYNEAIRQTNDEELLLNLVRLRYNEHPSFLPLTGLNAQFALSAGAQYRGGPERGAIDNFGDGTLGYADRPTLTFAPQRPPQLTKALLSQVDLDTLYLFSHQGNENGRVLRLFVRTINGLDNASSGGGPVPSDPPEFGDYIEVSNLIQRLSIRGILVLTAEKRVSDLTDTPPVDKLETRDLVEIKKAGYGVRNVGLASGFQLTESRTVRILKIHPSAVASPEVFELTERLGLQPYQDSYPVEEAPEGQLHRAASDGPRSKITITTRSILEVMYLLSKNVAVPPDHCERGLVRSTRNPDGTGFDWRLVSGEFFHVCVAKHRPSNAFVAVKYRDYWYYVEDRDLSSKDTLNMFSELLRLQKVGATEGQPLLSLPLGP